MKKKGFTIKTRENRQATGVFFGIVGIFSCITGLIVEEPLPFLMGLIPLLLSINMYRYRDVDSYWDFDRHFDDTWIDGMLSDVINNRFPECDVKHYCHRLGLPIADGANIAINMKDEIYLFETDRSDTWELPKSRITNVSKMTETEIQTHLKSSLGATVLGEAVAGIPGAFVGSLFTKRKDIALNKHFVVFDYIDKNNKSVSLVFELINTAGYFQKPSTFVKDFRSNRNKYAPPTNHRL